MTKITIEISCADAATITGVPAAPAVAPAEPATAANPAVSPSAELLAQAAAVGALNAGPAPDLVGVAAGPLASSIGGSAADGEAVSGGAAAGYQSGT